MNKTQKVELVAELKDKFERAGATFLFDYNGITVEKVTDLRNKLRESSVDFKVVRNTLARRAVEEAGVDVLKEHFAGPIAVAFSYSDAAAAAKLLTEFAKDEPSLEFKLATLGNTLLGLDEVESLAKLPSREVLLSRLVGVLNNVPGGLVGVLSGVPRKFVYTLKAIENSKG